MKTRFFATVLVVTVLVASITILVTGTVSSRYEEGMSMTVVERATTDVVTQLNDVLIRHSGDTEVRLKLVKGETARVFEIPFPVSVNADLYGELKSLLGPNCVV